MAKNMSIIRYKYKADRDFESVQFDGLGCPVGELKRLIIEKSIHSGAHHPKEDYDLIISNSTTHEEYRDPTDMIPRNTSVVVTRRMRGTLESLTPSTTRKPVISSDDIVNKYLRPAIGQSAVVETKPVPLEALNQSSTNNNRNEELSEEERLKQVLKSSQSTYMPTHRSNTSYTCHNCKQPGHLRNQCPLLLQSSSTNSTGLVNGSTSASSVNNDFSSKNDGIQSTSSFLPKSTQHSSHIITNQAPYHYGHRPRHPRHVDLIKRPTGIPRDGLIRMPVPVSMPGVLRDKTGQAVVPKQMAELLIENSDRKSDASAKRVLSPASMLPVKTVDEELPPDELLCPICKQIYYDAVITPCCHNSFCDDCIRTALIESEDHECPQCHRQHVALDHINPNLILRKHVNQWREERQQKSSINYSLPQTHESNTDSMTNKSANNQNLDELDEYDAAILPIAIQQPIPPIKNAPIVIKMKPIGRSPSPSSQTNLDTKSNDIITSEDDKTSDNDQLTYSQKEKTVEVPTTNNSSNEESSDKLTDSNISENEKSDRQTPPSQVAPVSTILSSPPTTTTTTMASALSVVPHYYPVHPHMPTHGQHIHPGIMYPSQIPPTSSTGLYSMPPNYYPPAMHVAYPGGQPVLPMGGMAHYPGHSAYPPIHPHHPIASSHIPTAHLNGYHIQHYESPSVPSLHHPNPSGSTLIPHVNNSVIKQPTLTADEFYSQQRSLQRIKRSTSRRRSHSRSSSYSSSTSSVSRTSSFSRRQDRYYRRSSRSRSRSRQRIDKRRRDDNRKVSPIRQQRRRSSRSKSKQRRSPARHRSPSDRNRTRTLPSSKDNHSTNYRKTSPARPPPPPLPPPPPSSSSSSSSSQQQQQRSTRDRERRRSPRPPPTALQSIQRTIVYSHDSSSSKRHSSRDNRRSKSRSRHRSRPNDDRTAPSSKIDRHSQSESTKSVSPNTVPSSQRRITLSSIITPVIEENSSKKHRISDSTDDKKRKRTHQQTPRKHRRHQSPNRNSRDRHIHQNQDDDDDDANIVVENTTADSRRVIEAQ